MDPVMLKDGDDIMRYSGTGDGGLSSEQVEQYTKVYGPNEMSLEEKNGVWKLLLEQFDDLLVRILLAAALISFILAQFDEEQSLMTSFVEPLVILLILAANACVGVWQERNAESALEALKEYEPESAKVIRQGVSGTQVIRSRELVPGDLVEVAAGDRVPADIRILAVLSTTLQIDQSILTGESASILKSATAGHYHHTDESLLFSGTSVMSGRARGVVVGTGLNTEIGRIHSCMAETQRDRTPLQKKLDDFSRHLSKVILFICLAVWLVNAGHFSDPSHGGSWVRGALYYFKVAVSLAVAAIPEGLPAVITTSLALGTRRMVKKNAIVRSLPSVETLGCTSVICMDKTGTLTLNRMTCSHVWQDRRCIHLPLPQASTVSPSRTHRRRSDTPVSSQRSILSISPYLLRAATLCNDADFETGQEALPIHERKCSGDATESALLRFAETFYGDTGSWRKRNCKVAEIPFNSMAKYQLSVHVCDQPTKKHFIVAKGAPEIIMGMCTTILIDGEEAPLDDKMRAECIQACENFGEQGERVLGFCDLQLDPEKYPLGYPFDAQQLNFPINAMRFLGLVSMTDPPRASVPEAVAKCRSAGIKVVMVTGDHPTTAKAIAKAAGILTTTSKTREKIEAARAVVVEGPELKEMTDDQLGTLLRDHEEIVFARTSPLQKLRVVEQFQRQGQIVAVTGDGVNDCLALKKADIGIAMGSGTAVAKSAADMVLANDDVSTIVAAVEEGRAIYSNMQQFIRYLISSNIGEVVCIFLITILGMPETLAPIQLLWVNLVTDGLPATALGFNPPEVGVMQRGPRKASEPLVSRWLLFRYLMIGLYVGAATTGAALWWYMYFSDGPQLSFYQLTHWMRCGLEPKNFSNVNCLLAFDDGRPGAMALSVLVTVEMLNALNSLSDSHSLLRVPPWKNLWLCASIIFSILLHFAVLYVRPLSAIFQVAPLTLPEWLTVLKLSLPVLLLDETLKFVGRNCVDPPNSSRKNKGGRRTVRIDW